MRCHQKNEHRVCMHSAPLFMISRLQLDHTLTGTALPIQAYSPPTMLIIYSCSKTWRCKIFWF